MAETAFANGLGGVRLEKVVGDLIVDIGTDQPSTPIAGQPIEFDFGLLQSNTREPVSLATSVGIDISHNGKSMVNCDLITEEPMTFLYYTFPESGNEPLGVQPVVPLKSIKSVYELPLVVTEKTLPRLYPPPI